MRISRGDLQQALRRIGEDEAARTIILDALTRLEPSFDRPGFDPREEITGPICDALFGPDTLLTKTIADGTSFTTRYSSKITRDFLMAGAAPEYMWEPQTSKALLALTRGARHVLIGGAYVGDHAVLIAKQIAPEGLVHCFEPSAASAELLALNQAHNGLDNIRIRQMGLWGSDEQLVLSGDDSHASPSKATEAGAEGSFPATTIDGYCRAEGVERLDLIQLDIEGGELEALRGAEGMLAMPAGQAPAVVFEVHSSYLDWSNGLDQTDIVRFMAAHGYAVFAIRDYNGNEPMPGRPVELVPPESCYLEGPAHGFNMLAVKDRALIDTAEFRVVSNVSPKLLKHRDPALHAPLH